MELTEYVSTVPKWAGTIKLPSYMTFPDLVRWEKVVKAIEGSETKDLSLMYDQVVPFLCYFVKEWNIDRLPGQVTPEEFPGSAELLNWLMECINAVFTATNEIDPNSLEPS